MSLDTSGRAKLVNAERLVRRAIAGVSSSRRFRKVARAMSSRRLLPDFVSRRLPVLGPVTISLPNGERVSYASLPDDSIKRSVFWRGWDGYERETFLFLLSAVSKFDLLIDVGANTGYFSIVSAKLNPSLSVVAVEAAPSTFSLLCQNVDENDLNDRVRCVHVAVGEKDGREAFGLAEFAGVVAVESALLRVGSRQAAFSKVIEVNVRRLDDIVTEDLAGLRVLLKIDVEGFEPEVLRGAEELLKTACPTVVFELLAGGPRQELRSLFDRTDYSLFRIAATGLVADEDLLASESGAPERNYVAIPRPVG